MFHQELALTTVQRSAASYAHPARLVQKVSRQRGEIARLASRNRRNEEQDFRHGIKRGAIMTIAEYLAATALTTLIVWAVLGLLMQE